MIFFRCKLNIKISLRDILKSSLNINFITGLKTVIRGY